MSGVFTPPYQSPSPTVPPYATYRDPHCVITKVTGTPAVSSRGLPVTEAVIGHREPYRALVINFRQLPLPLWSWDYSTVRARPLRRSSVITEPAAAGCRHGHRSSPRLPVPPGGRSSVIEVNGGWALRPVLGACAIFARFFALCCTEPHASCFRVTAAHGARPH